MDIGILVKSKRDETGLLHRFIDQIGVFEREPVRGGETANRMIMLVEDGKVVNYRLPKSLSRKFQIGEIEDRETKLNHLFHMAWNALAITELYLMDNPELVERLLK